MTISEPTITALQKVITGDALPDGEPIAPYRSGPELITFFNQFGADDTYSNFGTRWVYAENKLREHNSTSAMKALIEAAVDPRHFMGTEYECNSAVGHLNRYLAYDDLDLTQVGKHFQVISDKSSAVDVGGLFTESHELNHRFIQEQLQKCDQKLREKDYTGAITNARSLVEAVLREIENALTDDAPRYDGKLSSLYKRVYREMNLDPSQDGLSNSAREILSGLISAVSGLAPLRNAASDAHAIEYRPSRHHAELAVNCAKTIVRFLVDSLEHQIERDQLEVDLNISLS